MPCLASDPLGMIPSGVKAYLASQPVDFRKGPDGLVGLVRDAGADPFNGSLYVFRAKQVISNLLSSAGVACTPLPHHVRLRCRGNLLFAFNYGPESWTAPCSEQALRLGQKVVPAHGLSIWHL